MIDNEFGKFFVVCDVCGEAGQSCDTWQDAVNSKQEQHWISRKEVGGEWSDICPDCQ